MNICLCIDLMNSGGAERVLSLLSNELANQDHNITLILAFGKSKDSFYPLDKKINIIPLFSDYNAEKIVHPFSVIRRLKKHFKIHKYDAVISFLPNVNFYVWVSTLWVKNFLHIVSERNNPYVDPPNRLKRKIKEIAFKHSSGIVCQTNESSEYYRKKLKKNSVVIPNPCKVDTTPFNGNCNNTIISVGRLEPQKNFQLLISAFKEFQSYHPDAILKIFGEGSLEKDLKEQISLLGLDNSAFLCGNSKTRIQDNLDCAMFINTSLYEGMPNSLMEAMLAGMPCIASDCPVGGSRDLMLDNNGLLFLNNSKEDLIQKMNTLYRNPHLINQIKENCISARNKYNISEIAKKWTEYINCIRLENNGTN